MREEQRIRDYFKQIKQESAQTNKEFDRRNKSPVLINTKEDPMPAYDKINRKIIQDRPEGYETQKERNLRHAKSARMLNNTYNQNDSI